MNTKRFASQLLKTKAVSTRALPKGIEVTIYRYGGGRERKQSKRCDPAPQVYDLVLQAVGRTPNGKKPAAEKADMIGEIALAIEMGAVAVDICKTIHPHAMLGESISMRRKWHMAASRMCHQVSAIDPAL